MLHKSVFAFLQPTDDQAVAMNACRAASMDYATVLDKQVPEGPDKTYLMRRLREISMWANVAITRHTDGAPRTNGEERDPDT